MPTLDDLHRWLTAPTEDEHLEFKEAKHSYDRDKLVRYCAALANERGGTLVLGATDRPPRTVRRLAGLPRPRAGEARPAPAPPPADRGRGAPQGARSQRQQGAAAAPREGKPWQPALRTVASSYPTSRSARSGPCSISSRRPARSTAVARPGRAVGTQASSEARQLVRALMAHPKVPSSLAFLDRDMRIVELISTQEPRSRSLTPCRAPTSRP